MRHKTHNKGGVSGVNLGLIVTPMLDMSFQLLSFFIMVYSPNAAEDFIGGELGRTKSAVTPKDAAVKSKDAIKPKDSVPSSDVLPDLEQTYTVLITVIDPRSKGGAVRVAETKDGLEPRFIQIKSPANELDKEGTGNNLIDLATLITSADEKKKREEKVKAFQHIAEVLKGHYLEASMKDKGAKVDSKDASGAIKTKIRIEADRGIQFDYVVQVFAACKRAGFDDVTFTTPLD